MPATEQSLIFGIEGPAGSGKSTMANTVGIEMGIPVVEGGLFYRQLAHAAIQNRTDPNDTMALISLANNMPEEPRGTTDALRSETVSAAVSTISSKPEVRAVVKEQIRQAVLSHDTVIFVGRAIKAALPEAHVLHLTIDPEEAERRHTGRTHHGAQSVQERNMIDDTTAKILNVADTHEATVDVTHLTAQEQADVLQEFISHYL